MEDDAIAAIRGQNSYLRTDNDQARRTRSATSNSRRRGLADAARACNSGLSKYASTDNAHAEFAINCGCQELILIADAEIAARSGGSDNQSGAHDHARFVNSGT